MLYKLFLFAVLTTYYIGLVESDGLENFVRLKLANYSTWLKANNLDPSPPDTEMARIASSGGVVNLEYFFRTQMSGHANGIHRTGSIMSELTATGGYFETGISITGNITFYGDYVAFGTFLGKVPISVRGQWYINSPVVNSAMFRMSFAETPSGNLELISYTLYSLGLDTSQIKMYFENLLEDEPLTGCKEEVRGSLFYEYHNYLSSGDGYVGKHPFRKLYLKHWKEVLSETTLADIIATPLPPPPE